MTHNNESSMNKRGWIDEPLYRKIPSSIPIATVDLLAVHKKRLLIKLTNNEPAKDQWLTPECQSRKTRGLVHHTA